MKIPELVLHRLYHIAIYEAPRECCGVVGTEDDTARQIYQLPNIADDPIKFFQVDNRDLMDAWGRIEQEGWSLGATFHSHPMAEAYPSVTDMRQMVPGTLHLIVGLSGQTTVRGFRFTGDGVHEEEVIKV